MLVPSRGLKWTKQNKNQAAKIICNYLMQGMPLTTILNGTRDLPRLNTFYKWLLGSSPTDTAIKAKYEIARKNQARFFVDKILEDINDDRKRTKEEIMMLRVRVHALQWFAGKVLPMDYGDKIQIDHNVRVDLSVAIDQAKQRLKLSQTRPKLSQARHDTIEGVVMEPPVIIKPGLPTIKPGLPPLPKLRKP